MERTSSIFDTESTAQLEEYKEVLLHIYNEAEKKILAGEGTELDYQAYNEADNTLRRVQATLDRRAL